MGEMRGTCQNSLLTAKVTTLFPGPKRDNGRDGKVYIKEDWVGSHPAPPSHSPLGNPAVLPLPTRPSPGDAGLLPLSMNVHLLKCYINGVL